MASWCVCPKRLADVFVNQLKSRAVRLLVREGPSVSCSNWKGPSKGSTDHMILFISLSLPMERESNVLLILSVTLNYCGWRSKRMEMSKPKTWCPPCEICESSTGWSQTATRSAGTVVVHFDRRSDFVRERMPIHNNSEEADGWGKDIFAHFFDSWSGSKKNTKEQEKLVPPKGSWSSAISQTVHSSNLAPEKQDIPIWSTSIWHQPSF